MSAWKDLKQKLLYYLCPPGSGVYTVYTGEENRIALEQQLYKTSGDEVISKWQDSLENLPHLTHPIILGVCSDTGGGIVRGANWGPLYIRENLYKQNKPIKAFDLGDVRVIPQLLSDDLLNLKTIEKCRKALYKDPHIDLAVSPLSITYDVTKSIYSTLGDRKFLTLGGDHSISYPVLKSYLEYKAKTNKKIAVIHFDAHTDIMSDRLGIDICFGSWAYHLLQLNKFITQWIQIGIRSSRYPQSHWESNYAIKQFWATDFTQQTLEQINNRLLKCLSQTTIDEVYITFDIDALDINFAAATGTPEKQGLTLDQSCCLIEKICQEYPLTGADIAEVAPFISGKMHGSQNPEPETTLHSAAVIAELLLEYLDN